MDRLQDVLNAIDTANTNDPKTEDGSPAALFGFSHRSPAAPIETFIEELAAAFGPKALSPVSTFFADWSSGFGRPNGTLLGLDENAPSEFELSVLDVVGGNPFGEFIQAFGLDEAGEVYVATKTTLAPSALGDNGLPTGVIYRVTVVPEPSVLAISLPGVILIAWRGTTRLDRQ